MFFGVGKRHWIQGHPYAYFLILDMIKFPAQKDMLTDSLFIRSLHRDTLTHTFLLHPEVNWSQWICSFFIMFYFLDLNDIKKNHKVFLFN